jgi:hypothetical protein
MNYVKEINQISNVCYFRKEFVYCYVVTITRTYFDSDSTNKSVIEIFPENFKISTRSYSLCCRNFSCSIFRKYTGCLS